MEIQVKKGEGITAAIKRTLQEKEGATNNNFKGSVWNKILDLVDQQNEENKANGEKALYQGGNDRSNDYRNNYKVFVGQVLKFSANIWNKIKAVVGLTGTNPTQPEQSTEPTQSNAPAQPTESTTKAEPTATTETAQPVQNATTDDIKVNLPTTESFAAKNKKDGQKVAQEIKDAFAKCTFPFSKADVDNAENALKKITKNNIAYVLEAYPNLIQDIDDIDSFGYGFDKDEIKEYVLKPLAKRLGKSSKWIDETMSKSVQEIANTVNGKIEAAKQKEKEEVEKAGECFDKANDLLVEVVNMNPRPKVVRNEKSAKITLSDGRYIKVEYDANREITAINISYDTTPENNGKGKDLQEIRYNKNIAHYNIDKSNENWEGTITKGYNFEKLKAFVEQIFS